MRFIFGSGVSANSKNADGERPKTWVEVLKLGINRLPNTVTKKQKGVVSKAINNGDLLLACELLRKHLGPDDYKDLLKSEFFDKHFLKATIHEEIEQLDSRIVVTPNFDQIYERYVHSIPGNDVVVVKYNDNNIADVIRSAHRLIIKSHGDITAGDDIIFTKADYAKARSEYAQFYSVLDALLLTHTFVCCWGAAGWAAVCWARSRVCFAISASIGQQPRQEEPSSASLSPTV